MPTNDKGHGYGGGRSGSSGGTTRRQRSPSPRGSSSRYHSNSSSSSSHRDAYGRWRSSPSSRGNEEAHYTIPSTAPQLRVPSDLPVDTTAFIDLVAFYVVQGGPTAEEGIMRREVNNPHFAFLHSTWNDPKQLYYRWRLYSLLQGDTLLKWRTEPYQIERGKDAYVWVPPPPIFSGPECLLSAFADEGHVEKKSRKEACGNVHQDGAGALPRPVQQPQPSAQWLSRMCVSEGAFFVTLNGTDEAEWKKLLAMDDVLGEIVGATASASSSSIISPLQTPLSGTSSSVCNRQTLESRVSAMSASLLDAERIARRMVFAVEHQQAALHVMSLLLDEVVRLACAAVAAQRVRDDGFGGSDGGGRCAGSREKEDAALLAAARCCMCLSYLFTLNDIGKNSAASVLSDEEVASAAAASLAPGHTSSPTNGLAGIGGAGKVASTGGIDTPFAAVGPASTHHSPSSLMSLPLVPPSNGPIVTPTAALPTMRVLNRAVEKIMPTVIEATLLIALSTIHQYGSLQADKAVETGGIGAKPPGAEELEGILPMGADHAAYVHVQARLSATNGTIPEGLGLKREDRDAVCMIGLLLLSWLKQLCSGWSEGEVIGSRCWSTLVSKYAFLLSQSIETT
uniref:Putative RNA binding protein n=1 Tax=Trypanosoma congolense (strain IL3000) TaxID=1068625 RepID=G0UQW4_TRYCI|nr:putative RNA binding protein [Trypanosoma congolense IL3000]